MKDLKESFPVETAEYAHEHGLHTQPAFAWWVPHVIRKRAKIIAAVKHCMVKKNFKYGHQVPSSVLEAYELDKRYNMTR